MGGFATVLGPLVGQAFDGLTKIIGEFHMSPEEKVAAQQAIADAQAKAVAAAQDYEVQLNTIAGQNIQAEAKSGNFLTVMARPTFLYLMYFIIFFNYIALPLVQYFGGSPLSPINLPNELWFMFSSGYLGYVVARSFDKQQGLPGTSNITLPFGIGATNNPPAKVGA